MIARPRCFAVLLVLVTGLFGADAAAQERPETRLALVVGNAAYAAAPLPTAANDAGLVAQTLAQAGFNVTAMGNVGAESLRATVKAFLGKAQAAGPDAAIFVYLAGYGLQFDGDDYLLPVDAAIARDVDVPAAGMRLSDVTRALETAPARARIFVYDLARENPFAKTGLPLAGGLASVDPPYGSFIAFNAAPGTVAPPDVAPYGVYARALSEAIQQPGLSMDAFFMRVRLRVVELTNGVAVPWGDGKVDPAFTMYPAEEATPVDPPAEVSAIATLPAPQAFSAAVAHDTLAAYEAFATAFPSDRQAPRVHAMIAARRESLIWSESLRVNSSRAYWTYLRRYPRGPHFGDCRRRLAALRAALEPPPRFDIYAYEGLPPPSPEELAFVQKSPVILRDADWAPVPPPPPTLLPSRRVAFYEDLPPPPLPPAGALPLPVPVPLPLAQVRTQEHAQDRAGMKVRAREPGIVDQPFVPGYGKVVARSHDAPAGGATVTVTNGKDVVVSKTVAVTDRDTRTIVQKGGDDTVISRTVTTRAGDSVTTVQSGPAGKVLTRAVTRGEPGGARSTIVTDGADKVITDVQTDRGGVVTARIGAAPALPSAAAAPVTPPGPPAAPPAVGKLAPILAERQDRTSAAPAAAPSPRPSQAAPMASPAPPQIAPGKVGPAVAEPASPLRAPEAPRAEIAPAPVVARPASPSPVVPPMPPSGIEPGKPAAPLADPPPEAPKPVPRPDEIKGPSPRPTAAGRSEPRKAGGPAMPQAHKKGRLR